MKKLKEHELVIGEENSITRLGTLIASMPVDISIGKMLILSSVRS
jgi:HrpA-like RNA helicase